jgi:hypothetical protein
MRLFASIRIPYFSAAAAVPGAPGHRRPFSTCAWNAPEFNLKFQVTVFSLFNLRLPRRARRGGLPGRLFRPNVTAPNFPPNREEFPALGISNAPSRGRRA